MTFLETLQTHKGSLIRLKTELYWYGGRGGYDGNPGRICLLLDVSTAVAVAGRSAARTSTNAHTDAAYLLIDGSPQWVWVAEEDVEVINDTA